MRHAIRIIAISITLGSSASALAQDRPAPPPGVAGLGSTASTATTRATEPPPPDGISGSSLGGAASGLTALASGLTLFRSPSIDPNRASWRGGVLVDESFRSFMVASPEGQEVAAMISDITLLMSLANAGLIDALVTPLVRGEEELGWHATFAHALALGVTLSVGEVVKRAAGRARPFERDCQQNPDGPGCGEGDSYQSFYSGHSGMAFTSAGFSCAMHLSRQLYDDSLADGMACGTSLALATTTAMMRVVADRHYLTDVVVGAALGFLVGYLVPLAIVPERRPAEPRDQRVHPDDAEVIPPPPPGLSAVLVPTIAPGGGGTSLAEGTVGFTVMGAF